MVPSTSFPTIYVPPVRKEKSLIVVYIVVPIAFVLLLGGGAVFYYGYISGWRPKILPFIDDREAEMANYFNSDSFRNRQGFISDEVEHFDIPVVPQPEFDIDERL
jgi:hypothetical protein